jgi:hypothetical protein
MYFPLLQKYIYSENEDIIFSMYSTGIFSISLFFISLILNMYIISTVLSFIPRIKKTILWYEVVQSKTNDYYLYKKKNKRNIVAGYIILIISLFFLITSLFIYLRINESGIYYNKIFEFKEMHYKWDELKSVSISTKITYGKRKSKSLSPEMVLEFGENKLDIWEGAWLGSSDSKTLIKIIDIINRNTNIKINVETDFTDEMLDLLYNHSTDWKRNNILKVFEHLKESNR